MSEKKRAIGYIRVSSKAQAKEGESLSTQHMARRNHKKPVKRGKENVSTA